MLDSKLPLIAGLAVALILIYIYIIVIEYFHDRIVRKRTLTNLSHEELDEVLTNTLRDELMPYASIDAILERRRMRHGKGIAGRVHERVAERIEKAEANKSKGNEHVEADASKGGDAQ